MTSGDALYVKLAEDAFGWWKDIRCFIDIAKFDISLRPLLNYAGSHIEAKEWLNSIEACKSAVMYLQNKKRMLSLDSALQDDCSRSVIGLYFGITCIGLSDLATAKEHLRESAKHFEKIRFLLGAGLAYATLGRILLLDGDETACNELDYALGCLRPNAFVSASPEICAYREKLADDIRRYLNSLGCEMVDRPVPSSGYSREQTEPLSVAVPKPSQNPVRSELGVLAVSEGSVRAGDPVVLLDEIEDYAVTDKLVINGVPYGFFRFDGKRDVFQFRPGYDYRAVRVEGDSMNEIFEPGQFVILRIPKDGSSFLPRPGDIVAVQILKQASDPVPPTTLKEYRPRDDGKVELRPRTKNPEKHQKKIYSESEIDVRAIAIGKLRRESPEE